MNSALNINVPRPDDVEDILRALLGRNVVVKRAALGQKPQANGALAAYRDNEGLLRAVICAEMQAVNACGAALSMIPVGAVEDANDEGEIPPNVWDNFAEVLNILTSVFNDRRQRAEHVRLKEVVPTNDAEDELSVLLNQEGSRLDIHVQVAGGYGGGGLAVVVR